MVFVALEDSNASNGNSTQETPFPIPGTQEKIGICGTINIKKNDKSTWWFWISSM